MILTGASLPGGSDMSNILYKAVFPINAPGVTKLYVPIGTYLRADANDALVETSSDGQATWDLFEGDVAFLQKNTVDPSVADLCPGFSLDVPGGVTHVRITYCERRLLLQVPTVSPVRVVNDGFGNLSLDGAFLWNKMNPISWTNGALVCCALDPSVGDAFLLEVWRKTRKGGYSGPRTTRIRAGARFVPYFRTPVPPGGLFEATSIQRAERQKQKAFAFCLYDPATGARTQLSRETLHVYRATRTWVSGCYHSGP